MNDDQLLSTPSSGNIFADMGLEDADELLARAELGYTVRKLIKARGLTRQQEIAELLKIKQPEVSKLMNGKYHLFSEARLMTFLARLDQKMTLTITPRYHGEQVFVVHLAGD